MMNRLAYLILFISHTALAYTVTFIWDKSPSDTGQCKYRMYQKQAEGMWVPIKETPDSTDIMELTGLEENLPYTYRLTAFDNFSESPPSNEVTYIALPRLKMFPDHLRFQVMENVEYALDASSDLVHWEKVLILKSSTEFYDYPIMKDQPYMFFRLRRL